MPDELEWTDANAKEWRDAWNNPIMQRGLAILRDMATPEAVPLFPTQDHLSLAAAAHNTSVGRQDIFKWIKQLGHEKPKRKSLPQPWSKEALREELETP